MMKKIYTIGRDDGCDIVINDETDIISRLHATLRVESNGKIYLTDKSKNGTFINGMKMSSNVEIPVSRKDVVSLAHIHDLDWNKVPKTHNNIIKIILSIIVAVIVLLCYFIHYSIRSNPQHNENPINTPIKEKIMNDTLVVRDTVLIKDEVNNKENSSKEKERKKDSVIVKKDSIKKGKPKEKIIDALY